MRPAIEVVLRLDALVLRLDASSLSVDECVAIIKADRAQSVEEIAEWVETNKHPDYGRQEPQHWAGYFARAIRERFGPPTTGGK